MRCSLFRIAGLLTLVLSALVTTSIHPSHQTSFSAHQSFLSDIHGIKLAEGDLIFRRGYGMVSDYIAHALHNSEGVSHGGMLIRKSGKWYVMHAIPGRYAPVDGVQLCRLEAFIQDARPGSIRICRWKNEPSRIQKAVRKSMRLSGKAIPFDYRFDSQDTTAMYCTELLAWLYGVPSQRQGGIIGFQPFFDTSRFKVMPVECFPLP